MKYRIKIVNYNTGRQDFYAQFKKWYGWVGITYEGKSAHWADGHSTSRQAALQKIDLHFNGNSKVQSIEFEYIKK